MLQPRSSQRTLSSQSRDENWVCNLSFNPLFFFTDLKCRIFAEYFFFTNWLHESKRHYPGNSPCGFLLQQGHFASIGNEGIMIYSLKWGCCHLADTAQLEGWATCEPRVRSFVWLSTYGESPYRQINKNTAYSYLWLVATGNQICFEFNYWRMH